ncbi:helix-turn-helix transcriptional regulator [Bifidobacterium psychraerophilum]|jgi:antitoxin component of RelBE/YafQ-DinJ toxin-antitoxin module|uniref:DNA binding protein n=1 Tax=Bifidobacterium psychraerophilum TaxID=218140 RepID=A0A087CDT8_9BIFI|nr:helix-turn-helix transcriptional regulator [Bifidobacterium psychraerophilum]KFI81438.1 DNA binding protein [Bifidobacterium psychraerophilum]MCI1659813.1 helix-turn-helix domain-containing protein [Bifidobacterium psychraerophilum]MCI1804183.1 helix-turn-helix domain-containing protein [Bifidobacterium psychraerophilum]MCI2176630.1 helix-turn-helix domain-containing protein [Bifidobacterium psychraerophilum]MCI2181559.1 helix-turn-helix domain-containing protein [Bifidobacterium psychraero
MANNQTVLRHTEDSFELQTNNVHEGAARVRDLTPAQRRAVLFAQQQVIRARAAKKAKDERQAALARMWMQEEGGDARSMPAAAGSSEEAYAGTHQVSLREAIGHVLRDLRTKDHKTLREVSENAGVSLGYLSEVERGQKEASSELLSSIAEALGVSVSQMLRMVADYIESLQD